MPDENMNRTKYQVETLRQRSLKKPDEIIERTKRLNLQRLENESAYIASKGYQGTISANHMKTVSRKKAIPIAENAYLNQSLSPRRHNLLSLKSIVGLRKPL